MKKILINSQWFVALFLLAAAVVVNAGDYTYTTNSDNTLTITGYTGPGGDVIIPSAIDGKTVTIIGTNAFAGNLGIPNTNLISVTIPDSVTSIGGSAFTFCSELTNVMMIGNSVTNIGDNAFAFCGRLLSVTIPDSVISIGNGAFTSCWRLTNVTIPNGVTSIEGFTFWSCSRLTNVTIGNSVTNIGDYAFYSCASLTSVTIPGSVANMGFGVFYDAGLINVMISNGVASIGDSAFFGTSLTSVSIPNSVTKIDYGAFADCPQLTRVTFGNGVASIGDYAFSDSANLIGVYFTGNAPRISLSSFVFRYDNLATVYYLPDTTGWGPTFGDRPAVQWWDGPQISANGIRGDVTINRGDTLMISVAMNTDNHVGFPVDWWVLGRANSSFYYLNNAGQWTQFDGNFSNCHPVYQGGLFNLPALEVLNARGLQPGSYTFWFAVDYPMDGILNLGGYILLDSVNVTVK